MFWPPVRAWPHTHPASCAVALDASHHPRQKGLSTVRDIVITAGVSVCPAALLVSYLGIVYGLLWRPPRWRAVVALVVPVLAPFWAWREKMYVRAALFVLSAIGYAVFFTLARQA